MVILDIMMPGLDGFQVLDIIRQHSDIPVIMLSTKREVTIKRDALTLGADDYVGKPFHTGELVARIRAKLRRAG
ncbi:response regulator transcription factor [Chloroflexota bacterium]